MTGDEGLCRYIATRPLISHKAYKNRGLFTESLSSNFDLVK